MPPSRETIITTAMITTIGRIIFKIGEIDLKKRISSIYRLIPQLIQDL